VLNHSGITRSLSLSADQSGWTGPDVEPEKWQATSSLDYRERLASQFEEMAEVFLFVDDLVQRLCGTRQSELDKANSRGGRLVGAIKFCHQLAGEETLRRRNASAKISLCEEFA
jgi:hypothetical protein